MRAVKPPARKPEQAPKGGSRRQFAVSVARLVRQMQPDEIDAFLAALLPDVDDDERDEWFAQIVYQQRKGDRTGKPAEQVFAALERGNRPRR